MRSREPVAAFWIVAAVVLLPIVYVASFGPACWLFTFRTPVPDFVPHRAMIIYFPLGKAINGDFGRGPQRLFSWWMNLGVPPGRTALVPASPFNRNKVIGFEN